MFLHLKSLNRPLVPNLKPHPLLLTPNLPLAFTFVFLLLSFVLTSTSFSQPQPLPQPQYSQPQPQYSQPQPQPQPFLSMSSVIQVTNLSKIYRLGEIGTGTISRDLERRNIREGERKK